MSPVFSRFSFPPLPSSSNVFVPLNRQILAERKKGMRTVVSFRIFSATVLNFGFWKVFQF